MAVCTCVAAQVTALPLDEYVPPEVALVVIVVPEPIEPVETV